METFDEILKKYTLLDEEFSGEFKDMLAKYLLKYNLFLRERCCQDMRIVKNLRDGGEFCENCERDW